MSDLELERVNLGLPGQPPLWFYRVRLTERQALVAYKARMLEDGSTVPDAPIQTWIQFALGSAAWPCTYTAETIYDVIARCKGDDSIHFSTCLQAIRMLQAAVGTDQEEGQRGGSGTT